MILIFVFLLLIKKGYCIVTIKVLPCKQAGEPYPYLTQVITQEILEEINGVVGVKVTSNNPLYTLACSVSFDKIFKVEFILYKGNEIFEKKSFLVRGDKLFIEVKRHLFNVLEDVLHTKPKIKSGFLKKLKSVLEGFVFLRRGFELNIPVPLPPPPEGFLR